MKKLKKVPDFKTEDEEREFWSKHDSPELMIFPHKEGQLLCKQR